jgi:hypothetical protein
VQIIQYKANALKMKRLKHLVLGQHEEMEELVAIKKNLHTRCHICERDGKLKKGKA